MTISEFINEMDKLYPRTMSAPWDTDGLQCSPDPERELRKVLIALDAGKNEIECAVDGGYDLLLTHHPMVFGSTGNIVPMELYGNRIIKLITSGVSAASFHTRLDAGVGGVNDCLAELLGLRDIEKFGDDEIPELGRIGELDEAVDAEELSGLIKNRLGTPCVRLSGKGSVKRIAVVGGAGKSCVHSAKAACADAILTGEVSYNAALDFAEEGIIVIEAGHYYTEFPVCRRLAELACNIAGAEADIFESVPQLYF